MTSPNRRAGSVTLEATSPGGGTHLPAPVHDCWRTIGVMGNGSCAELQKFVHCRNCPVFSAAALQLLDRPVWPQYLQEHTRHYAEARRPAAPARLSVLVFRIGWEWLALPTAAFQEIVERRFVHSLPHRRNGIVLGLVNVRGELIVCVSLGRLLGLEPPTAPARNVAPEFGGRRAHESRAAVADSREERSPTPGAAGAVPGNGAIPRLVVTQWKAGRLAFPVDEVYGVVRLAREEIVEPPATVGVSAETFTTGVFSWQERAVGFLDADALFEALNRQLS